MSPSQISNQSGTATRHPPQALTFTSAARSTPCCICFTRGSGTRFCSTSATSRRPNHFSSSSIKAWCWARTTKRCRSRAATVIPVDVPVAEVGTDALRLYEMFMGPLEMVKPWNTKGVEGVYRFLGRVWRLFVDEKSETEFEQAETTTTEAQSHQRIAESDQTESCNQRCRGDSGAIENASRLHQKSHGRFGRDAFQHGDFRDDGFCERGDDVGNKAGFRAARIFDFAPALRAASGGRIVGKTSTRQLINSSTQSLGLRAVAEV